MGHDVRNLGKLEDRSAQIGVHLRRFRQRNSAGHLGVEPDRALVELRQKLAPDCYAEANYGDRRSSAEQVSDAWPTQRALQNVPISRLQPAEDTIVKDAPRLAIR